MGQPTILRANGRSVAKFGSAALPNGQGAMAQVDLNDYVNTLLTDYFRIQDGNVQLGLEQLLYRGRSVIVSQDFGPRAIALAMTYLEDGSHFLGQFLALLSQAGTQQLTFDNATYILAHYAGISGRVPARARQPLAWDFTLLLTAPSPFFQDAAAQAATPWNPIVTDAGQAANITYLGSVWAEPVWTLHVPAGNAVAINSFQLKNTMSGETLTVNFLSASAIPAGTVRDVVIDCGAMTAVCTQTGESYDVSGSFPMLYPPGGQVNPFTAILIPAAGASAGLTLA